MEDRDPRRMIVRLACAYGQPVLREFLLGSVTKTVLRDSPVPLFLYH